MRRFIVTPGESITFMEIDDTSYIVIADDDDCPPEEMRQTQSRGELGERGPACPWDDFMETADANSRVCVVGIEELLHF